MYPTPLDDSAATSPGPLARLALWCPHQSKPNQWQESERGNAHRLVEEVPPHRVGYNSCRRRLRVAEHYQNESNRLGVRFVLRHNVDNALQCGLSDHNEYNGVNEGLPLHALALMSKLQPGARTVLNSLEQPGAHAVAVDFAHFHDG